jgi:hypothetical protein
MTQDELQDGVLRVWRTFYSGRQIARRALRTTSKCFAGTRPVSAACTQVAMKTLLDLNYHRMVANIDRSFKSFC